MFDRQFRRSSLLKDYSQSVCYQRLHFLLIKSCLLFNITNYKNITQIYGYEMNVTTDLWFVCLEAENQQNFYEVQQSRGTIFSLNVPDIDSNLVKKIEHQFCKTYQGVCELIDMLNFYILNQYQYSRQRRFKVLCCHKNLCSKSMSIIKIS